MGNARFDLEAKIPPGATREDVRVMIRALLAERFALKVHTETRELQVLEMVVSKSGMKLTVSSRSPGDRDVNGADPRTDSRSARVPVKEGFPTLPAGNYSTMVVGNGKNVMRETGNSSPMLAVKLSRLLGTLVIDSTGLTGMYDFILYWVVPNPTTTEIPFGSSSPQDGPTLIEAVKDQLGLELRPKKQAVEVTIVDYAEKVPLHN